MVAGKDKITTRERCEIIDLKGTLPAHEIGQDYGLSASGVKSIWFKARKERGEIVTEIFRTRYSTRTGMMLRDDIGESPYLKPIERSLREALEDPLVETGKRLVDLGPEDCRWRTGKDSEGQFRFCACPRVGGRTCRAWYCEAHAELVVGQPLSRDSREFNRPVAARHLRVMPPILSATTDEVDDVLMGLAA